MLPCYLCTGTPFGSHYMGMLEDFCGFALVNKSALPRKKLQYRVGLDGAQCKWGGFALVFALVGFALACKKNQ